MPQTLEGGTVSDQERMELINKLCKLCSRQRFLPKSMHIADCLNEFSEIRSQGGNADVWEGIHKERRVAVKVLRMYATNDPDVILSVSVSPVHVSLRLERGICRDFAGRRSCGSTSNMKTSSRSSVLA